MKTDDINSEIRNQKRLCSYINTFGSNEHPLATPETLKYFKPEYINECLDKAIHTIEILKQ